MLARFMRTVWLPLAACSFRDCSRQSAPQCELQRRRLEWTEGSNLSTAPFRNESGGRGGLRGGRRRDLCVDPMGERDGPGPVHGRAVPCGADGDVSSWAVDGMGPEDHDAARVVCRQRDHVPGHALDRKPALVCRSALTDARSFRIVSKSPRCVC